MRHGESTNNAIQKGASTQGFQNQRQADAPVNEKGMADSIEMGKELAKMGFKIDKFISSAYKRAVQSSKYVWEGYG